MSSSSDSRSPRGCSNMLSFVLFVIGVSMFVVMAMQKDLKFSYDSLGSHKNNMNSESYTPEGRRLDAKSLDEEVHGSGREAILRKKTLNPTPTTFTTQTLGPTPTKFHSQTLGPTEEKTLGPTIVRKTLGPTPSNRKRTAPKSVYEETLDFEREAILREKTLNPTPSIFTTQTLGPTPTEFHSQTLGPTPTDFHSQTLGPTPTLLHSQTLGPTEEKTLGPTIVKKTLGPTPSNRKRTTDETLESGREAILKTRAITPNPSISTTQKLVPTTTEFHAQTLGPTPSAFHTQTRGPTPTMFHSQTRGPTPTTFHSQTLGPTPTTLHTQTLAPVEEKTLGPTEEKTLGPTIVRKSLGPTPSNREKTDKIITEQL